MGTRRLDSSMSENVRQDGVPLFHYDTTETSQKIEATKKMETMRNVGFDLDLNQRVDCQLLYPFPCVLDVLQSSEAQGGMEIDASKAVLISCNWTTSDLKL